MNSQDLANWKLSHHGMSEQAGLHHLYWQQVYQGIPVQSAFINISMDDQGKVWSLGNRFVHNIQSKQQNSRQLSAIDAVSKAINALQLGGAVPRLLKAEDGPTQLTIFDKKDIALENILTELRYRLYEEEVRLGWSLGIYTMDSQHDWHIFVDAESGEILFQEDRVLHCAFHSQAELNKEVDLSFAGAKLQHAHSHKSHNLFAPDSYRVFPLPVESPSHGARALVVNPADATASPFGWHDTDGIAGAEFTITRGNNAYAREDQDGNNVGGFSPDGGATLDFDFTLDFGQSPIENGAVENVSSAVTNLFYWNNITHDILYQYGFDEANGNYQENNYGNGGIGGDCVDADAQDGSALNNANFRITGDGAAGRMQMFFFDQDFLATVQISAPGGIAGNYAAAVASFGPHIYNVSGDVVLVDDGSGAPTEGCNPLVNGGDVNGKIALIDRGNCDFFDKAENAQNAGAIGVILVNNVAGNPIVAGGGAQGFQIGIPVVMISQADGALIKTELNNNITVTADIFPDLTTDLDGDFDNLIIVHEYVHGVSTRLTGGPGNASCLFNEEQAGEGWSDWIGLVLTHDPGHTRNTARGVGTYVLGEPITGNGLRSFPYSTDLGVNPHTYDAIKTEAIPHGVGSVFAVMLWDIYWDLIDQYGYDPDLYGGTGGNNIALQLVLDGMKLQPCSPGFVDMRDAILAADQANNGGANQTLLWTAFARRGLGFSASQGDPDDRSDGVEAFDLPPALPIELLEFSGTTALGKVFLSWSTRQELNNQGFELQRYDEEQQVFEKIAWIDGQGDTDEGHEYHFVDENVRANQSYVYRLKQVDVDGKFSFSDKVRIELGDQVEQAVKILPNPLEASSMQLQIWGLENTSPWRISVLDRLGKRVYERKITPGNGQDVIYLDLGELAAGMYTVEIISNANRIVEKLIIR